MRDVFDLGSVKPVGIYYFHFKVDLAPGMAGGGFLYFFV